MKKVGYLIHKSGSDSYSLCKILKEYETLEEVESDLMDLLSKNTTEKKLLKENEGNEKERWG